MPKKAKKASQAPINKAIANDDRECGMRIKLARLQQGMSQQQLGDRLSVTFQQIQKYEKGANRITATRLKLIAGILGTTPHQLLAWKEEDAAALIDGEVYKMARVFMSMKRELRPVVFQLITLIANGA